MDYIALRLLYRNICDCTSISGCVRTSVITSGFVECVRVSVIATGAGRLCKSFGDCASEPTVAPV
jgi:hypothetical protein